MTIYNILSFPHPVLKQKASLIDQVDGSIRTLMDDMMKTMHYKDRGIGLAANQIGILKRLIVIDIGPEYNDKPLMMANPEITWRSSDDYTLQEGCLSVPDQWANVVRPEGIRVRYLDEHNNLIEQEAHGLLSACIQHECDHLDGVLFIDHLSSVKRKILMSRLLKAHKRSQEASTVL